MATTNFLQRNRTIGIIVLITLAILSIPLIGMQFSSDVQWSPFDFLLMGSLMIGTGVLWDLTTRHMKNRQQRAVVGLVLLAILLLVWVELAVGIFD